MHKRFFFLGNTGSPRWSLPIIKAPFQRDASSKDLECHRTLHLSTGSLLCMHVTVGERNEKAGRALLLFFYLQGSFTRKELSTTKVSSIDPSYNTEFLKALKFRTSKILARWSSNSCSSLPPDWTLLDWTGPPHPTWGLKGASRTWGWGEANGGGASPFLDSAQGSCLLFLYQCVPKGVWT